MNINTTVHGAEFTPPLHTKCCLQLQDVGDLPSPTDGSVVVKRQLGAEYAAVTFSGVADEQQV